MIQFTYYAHNNRSENLYIPEISTVVNFDEDANLVELFTELWRLARYAGYHPDRKTVKDLIEELEYRSLIEDVWFEDEEDEE